MLKQKSFHYWHGRMQFFDLDKLLFSDNGSEYSQTSRFVYMAFVDTEKDIFKCGWSMHENYEKMLGFIEHIFVPAAFYNWYDRHSAGFYLPMSDFSTVKEQVELYEEEVADKSVLLSLKENVQNMKHHKLVKSCESINTHYIDNKKRVFIKVYDGISEVKDEIMSIIPFDELFEEEMGMDRETFNGLCENLNDETFFKKRLVSYLNNNIPIIF